MPIVELFKKITGYYLEGYDISEFKLRYWDTEGPLSKREIWYSSCEFQDEMIEIDGRGLAQLFRKKDENWKLCITNAGCWYFDLLSSWFFDYRGLIDAGLAIDANTVGGFFPGIFCASASLLDFFS